MASSIPSQERTVDPFASYNSNSVNKLTSLISKGQNCLLSANDLRVTINDSTSVNVSTGYAINDNVLIQLTSAHKVDIYDIDHYLNNDPFPEPIYNYVVLDYSYMKSRPAPEASIKILRASERTVLAASSNLQLLKVLKLSSTGPHIIESLLDYDPENTSNKRTTAYRYGAGEAYLPTFSSTRDTSRIVYDNLTDTFYFGISDRWLSLNSNNFITRDTSGLAKGDLVYVDPSNNPQKAISKFPIYTADGVVTETGTLTSKPQGRIQTTGKVEGVYVESNVAGTVDTGDLLYLSLREDGKVTNVESYPFSQFVGRCLETIDSTSINMLFVRGFVSPTLTASYIPAGVSSGLDSGSWLETFDGTSTIYYQEIDISGINGKNAIISTRDTSNNEIIEPYNIEFISNDVARLYMLDNTSALAITVIGPAITPGVDAVNVIRSTLVAGSWNLQGDYYYQDVDISSIGSQNVVVGIRDQADDMKIDPVLIEVDSTSNVRVWMPDNSETVTVTVCGISPSDTFVCLVTEEIEAADWTLSGGSYYYDINTAIIDNQDVIVNAREDSTNELIRLEDVEFVDSDTLRVWMPDTRTIHIIVVG